VVVAYYKVPFCPLISYHLGIVRPQIVIRRVFRYEEPGRILWHNLSNGIWTRDLGLGTLEGGGDCNCIQNISRETSKDETAWEI
jgi:hypothetical protein